MKKLFIVFFLMNTVLPLALLGGVRQFRSANSTNTQAYVNPNYANQATTYRQQGGVVSVNPGQAIIGQNGTAVYNGYGAVVVGGYYNDYGSWNGTAPTGSTIPIGTILEYAPSSAVPVMVEGTRYYYENNVYLAEVFDGSAVVYQVVPAPLGAVVTQLPAGCMVQNYNGKSFQLCGSTYYQQVAGGYQVVAAN
jgi:hypothetical protein